MPEQHGTSWTSPTYGPSLRNQLHPQSVPGRWPGPRTEADLSFFPGWLRGLPWTQTRRSGICRDLWPSPRELKKMWNEPGQGPDQLSGVWDLWPGGAVVRGMGPASVTAKTSGKYAEYVPDAARAWLQEAKHRAVFRRWAWVRIGRSVFSFFNFFVYFRGPFY